MRTNLFMPSFSIFILLTAGCTQMSLREDFGHSTQNNREVQTVNPSAEYLEVPTATLDGQKAEKVIDEYRQERANAPTEVMTQ